MERFGGPSIATAATMTKEDVQKIMELDAANPTVDKLIFIETRKGPNVDRKVFPCYPMALVKVKDDEFFTVSVAQSYGHQYMFGIARLPAEDLGVTYRFWDYPPNEDLMNVDPLKPAEKPPEEPKSTEEGTNEQLS